MQATPATWQMLLASNWPSDSGLKAICGGEAMAHSLAERLLDRVSSLWNIYGPTETTVWSTTRQVKASEYGDRKPDSESVSIGHPIANTTIYILDEAGQPTPTGVAGELLIGGHGLARGYLNQADLTAEKFIPNPFSPEKSERLYKTGDLARYLAHGDIEFIGRSDKQVKIRGFRIELGEIEAILLQQPTIKEAVVIVREDTPGNQILVAYLVPGAKGDAIAIDQIRTALQQQLPQYMIPSFFVTLERLPLTPNGKVDRRNLPAPDKQSQASQDEYVTPRTEVEKSLAEIWQRVLGLDTISIKDNFFQVGGHSLLAVQIFSQIETQLKESLPLSSIFQFPTIEGLASLLSSEVELDDFYSLIPIRKEGGRPILFGIQHTGFYDLAKYLGEDQPVYALHYGISEPMDKPLPLPAMEQLVAHFIQEIRMVQAQGPYFLMGLSFGGVIAYEIAQQLMAQGQQVATIVLFDTNLDYSNQIPDPGYSGQKCWQAYISKPSGKKPSINLMV